MECWSDVPRRLSDLSRRDAMKVAWHEVPGNKLPHSNTPSLRVAKFEDEDEDEAPLIILAKADIFQALVKAVGLFELGDGNRVGAVPTALEQFSIEGKNFIDAGRGS